MSKKEKDQAIARRRMRELQRMRDRGQMDVGELPIPAWLTVEGFEGTKLTQVVLAAAEWGRVYGVERKISIRPLEEEDKHFIAGGIRYTREEKAEAGLIEVDPDANIRHNVIHGMTHAVKPDDPHILPQPIDIPQGIVYGFHGLNLLVRLHDGTASAFRVFEEGMCERNAALLGNYTASERHYFEVGKLTLDLFPKEHPDVHNWVKQNGVYTFVQGFFRLAAPQEVTLNHIYQAMNIYDDAWKKR